MKQPFNQIRWSTLPHENKLAYVPHGKLHILATYCSILEKTLQRMLQMPWADR